MRGNERGGETERRRDNARKNEVGCYTVQRKGREWKGTGGKRERQNKRVVR